MKLKTAECYQSHLIEKIKICEFLCSHFNIEEDARKCATFLAYYFKKGTNATETQTRRFVQCMEKVLWLVEHVRSGLRSFVLEISHWTMLHGWVDQLKLTAIKSRHWEQSMLYHEGDTQHIQNIHMKRWKSFVPGWLC